MERLLRRIFETISAMRPAKKSLANRGNLQEPNGRVKSFRNEISGCIGTASARCRAPEIYDATRSFQNGLGNALAPLVAPATGLFAPILPFPKDNLFARFPIELTQHVSTLHDNFIEYVYRHRMRLAASVKSLDCL